MLLFLRASRVSAALSFVAADPPFSVGLSLLALSLAAVGEFLPGLMRCRLESCSGSDASDWRLFNTFGLEVCSGSGSGTAIAEAIELLVVSFVLVVVH